MLGPRGTGLKRGDGGGFGGTVAACNKGARQSRAEQWRRCWGRDASPSALDAPEADLDAVAAATAGRFGAMGAASAEGRRG